MPTIPLRDRFLAKLNQQPTERGCWLWTGAVNGASGYGHIANGGHLIKAHRAAYELFVGPIPAGLSVLHRCDVRRCCNPAHLFLRTYADNMRDREAKGRHNAPRGTHHGRHKLTEPEVRDIRAQHHAGTALNVMAAHYGVTKQSVWAIVHRKTWVHLD